MASTAITDLPFGFFSGGDIESYRAMYAEVPIGGTTCEVGSLLGKSLLSVADIIVKRDLLVHVVDTWGDLLNGSGEPNRLPLFMDQVRRFGIQDRLVLHPCLSLRGAQQIAPHSLDFVFIDADHSFEAADADIKAYRPLVKLGGWMAGHDALYATVKRALMMNFSAWEEKPDAIWGVRL